ncbi:hypothetical protein ACWCXX_30365, partial [Streptomyces sp. NPDC001732]
MAFRVRSALEGLVDRPGDLLRRLERVRAGPPGLALAVLRTGEREQDGSPLVAAARPSGCRVAYLPGLSMRRAADLYPGEAKT